MNNTIANPLVSIVIPLYNVATYIEEMLISIINQSYKNWELLLVDDGSTDNTIEVVQRFLVDTRIFLFIRPNSDIKGAQSCRNIGMHHSKGKYICFFDGDDVISNECIEVRVNAIEKSDRDFCIFPAADFTYSINDYRASKRGISSGEDVLASFLRAKYQFTVWTNIYKTNSLANIEWDKNVKIYQDLDFNIQCLVKGLTYEFVESPPNYFYRQRVQGSISSVHMTDEKLYSTIYLFSKILQMIKTYPNYPELKKAFVLFNSLYYNRIVRWGNNEQKLSFLKYIEASFGVGLSQFYKRTTFLHKILGFRSLRVINQLSKFGTI